MLKLEIKNLYKHFDGIKAVDHLSLVFAPSKITGLIGPNGSGKSTLINLLTGVLPYDTGVIIIGGKSRITKMNSYNVASHGITRTFQDVRLFEQLQVLDNVLVVLTSRNVRDAFFEKHKKCHVKKAKEVLEKMGLWKKRNELVASLSYGQRKLLEIARSLAMDTDTYFFDEPFAGLFPEMIKVVVSVLQELRDKGKTVVLVEHNMDLIRELCDHCIVLDDGKLLAEGNPHKVLSQRNVIEAYLGE